MLSKLSERNKYYDSDSMRRQLTLSHVTDMPIRVNYMNLFIFLLNKATFDRSLFDQTIESMEHSFHGFFSECKLNRY